MLKSRPFCEKVSIKIQRSSFVHESFLLCCFSSNIGNIEVETIVNWQRGARGAKDSRRYNRIPEIRAKKFANR